MPVPDPVACNANAVYYDPRQSGWGDRQIETHDPNPVAETFRAIRKSRRMSAAEVARAMGMVPRSYENLEAGTGRITYERICAFAQATNSDPVAILTSLSLGTPDFAVRCADNKLMTIMLIAMRELDEELGNDLTYLTAQTLVGGFTRLARDLARHVRDRETSAEEWLRAGSTQLAPSRSNEPSPPLKPKRA